MAEAVASRIMVLDAVKKMLALGASWPDIVKHLNKNGMHPGSRRRWHRDSLSTYWHKYKHLLDKKSHAQSVRASKRIERLKQRYPRHKILPHSKMGKMIQEFRVDNNQLNSWSDVAKMLNARRIIHEEWRGRSAKWNKESIRYYVGRHNLEETKKPALAKRADEALFEGPSDPISTPRVMRKASSDCTRKVEINFQELSDAHQLAGTIRMGTDKDTSTVRFTYEGELTPATQEYLRSFNLIP